MPLLPDALKEFMIELEKDLSSPDVSNDGLRTKYQADYHQLKADYPEFNLLLDTYQHIFSQSPRQLQRYR